MKRIWIIILSLLFGIGVFTLQAEPALAQRVSSARFSRRKSSRSSGRSRNVRPREDTREARPLPPLVGL